MAQETIKNIHDAIRSINSKIPDIEMSGQVGFKGTSYKYAKEADILSTFKVLFDEHNVVPIFTELSNKTTLVGDKYLSEVTMSLTLTHLQSSTSITLQGSGLGIDPLDKSIYKAYTGCKKYLYRSAFMLIMGGDDPEEISSLQQKSGIVPKEIEKNKAAKETGKLSVSSAEQIKPATPKTTQTQPPLDPIDNLPPLTPTNTIQTPSISSVSTPTSIPTPIETVEVKPISSDEATKLFGLEEKIQKKITVAKGLINSKVTKEEKQQSFESLMGIMSKSNEYTDVEKEYIIKEMRTYVESLIK